MAEVFFTERIGAVEFPNYSLTYKSKKGDYKTIYFKDAKSAEGVRRQLKKQGNFTLDVLNIAPLVKGEYDAGGLEYMERTNARKRDRLERTPFPVSRETNKRFAKSKKSTYRLNTGKFIPANSKMKGIAGFTIDNPLLVTGIVAVGTYILAKKAKLI
jgi:hypothetical protein